MSAGKPPQNTGERLAAAYDSGLQRWRDDFSAALSAEFARPAENCRSERPVTTSLHLSCIGDNLESHCPQLPSTIARSVAAPAGRVPTAALDAVLAEGGAAADRANIRKRLEEAYDVGLQKGREEFWAILRSEFAIPSDDQVDEAASCKGIEGSPTVFKRLGAAYDVGLQRWREEFWEVLRVEFAIPIQDAKSSLSVAQQIVRQPRQLKSPSAIFPGPCSIAESRHSPAPKLIEARVGSSTAVRANATKTSRLDLQSQSTQWPTERIGFEDYPDPRERIEAAYDAGLKRWRDEFLVVLRAELATTSPLPSLTAESQQAPADFPASKLPTGRLHAASVEVAHDGGVGVTIHDYPGAYERLGAAYDAGLQRWREEFRAVLRAEFALPTENTSSSLALAEERILREHVVEESVLLQQSGLTKQAATSPRPSYRAESLPALSRESLGACTGSGPALAMPALPSRPPAEKDMHSQLEALCASVQQVCRHLEDSSPRLLMTIEDPPSAGPSPGIDTSGLEMTPAASMKHAGSEISPAASMKHAVSETASSYLLPLWLGDAKSCTTISDQSMLRPTLVDSIQLLAFSGRSFTSNDLDEAKHKSPWMKCVWMEMFIIHPGSRWVVFWDGVGGLFIAYDVLMIPMENFTLPKYVFFEVVARIILFYWTMDVAHRFFIGFFDKGLLEMRPARIVGNYLRTWFAIDMFVVSMDWLLIATSAAESQATRSWRIGRAVRAVRLLRLIRLIRIVKFLKLMHFLMDCIRSEWRVLSTKACYTVVAVLVTVHYLACYWYAMGMPADAFGVWDWGVTTSWVREHGLEGATVGNLYAACMHWALAQTGLASTQIVPTNPLEQWYSVICSLFWLATMPFIIACVTTWLLQIREVNADFVAQEAQLRTFMAHHKISVRLTNLVFRFFRVHYENRAHIMQEPDIAIFNSLPPLVHITLHGEMYMPFLKLHPALSLLALTNTKSAISVCHFAMSECYLNAGVPVFCDGQEAQAMVIVASGACNYYVGKRAIAEGRKANTRQIKSGEWVCEVCLWRQWVHRGTLEAARTSELVSLSTSRFQTTLSECANNGWTNDALRTYASNIVESLSGASDLCEDVDLIVQVARLSWDEASPRRDWSFKTFTKSRSALGLRKSADDLMSLAAKPNDNITTEELRADVRAISARRTKC